MEIGLRITWGSVITGRENEADQLFGDALAYFGKMYAGKKLTFFEPFFVDTSDQERELGFFVAKGPAPEIFRMLEEDEYKALLAKAHYVVNHLKVDLLTVGEGIGGVLERAAKARVELGI